MPPGKYQRPGRALPEPGGEQRRPADFGGDQRLDLLGFEHEQVRTRWSVFGIRQPHHDAVITGCWFLIDPVPLEQSAPHRQGERTVHLQPVRRVQDHPPVAEFVAESLDQQGGVAGHDVGGRALVVDQRAQIGDGELVEADFRAALSEGVMVQTGDLAGELSDGLAQLRRAAGFVTAPER